MAQASYTGIHKSLVRQGLLEDWNKALKRLCSWLYLVLNQAAKDPSLGFKAKVYQQHLWSRGRHRDLFFILQLLLLLDIQPLTTLITWLLGQFCYCSWVSSCTWRKESFSLKFLFRLCIRSLQHQVYFRTQKKVSGFSVQTQERKMNSLEGNGARRPFFSLMH